MSTESNSKRRKTDAAADNALHINDLPIGFLVDVASYLATPSRALFAVAMSMHHQLLGIKTILSIDHRHHHPTKAIISSSLSNLDTLDFEDIEKSLAAKLNDEDINAILQCINAKNLKRLKLAGCVNINGWGL